MSRTTSARGWKDRKQLNDVTSIRGDEVEKYSKTLPTNILTDRRMSHKTGYILVQSFSGNVPNRNQIASLAWTT